MKRGLKLLINSILWFSLMLTSCTATKNTTWIPLNMDKIEVSKKENTLSTVYANNFFQSRFMQLASTITRGGVISAVIDQSSTRKSSNEFEKKLGDFSVLSYFYESFYKKSTSLKFFDLHNISDATEHPQVIKTIITYDKLKLDTVYESKLIKSDIKFISAFKLQYGIGARAGREQFGMKKSYRLFVRVVGLIKNINTNEFVWGNKIIVFSEQAFIGRDQAKNAPEEELIDEFKTIISNLTDILIDDMNGNRYNFKEMLVDYNLNDDLL